MRETFSSVRDLTEGSAQVVIDDPTMTDPKNAEKVQRVLLCSGKVYYTLDAARKAQKVDNVAIIRLEQLYPFPKQALETALARYRRRGEVSWVQEESANRGAWRYIDPLLRELLPDNLIKYFGRDASASPAAGSQKLSDMEESQFVTEALEIKAKSEPEPPSAVAVK